MKTITRLTPLLLASLKPAKTEYTLYVAQCDGLALRVQPGGARSWVCWHKANGKSRRITLGRLEDLSLDAARAAHMARAVGQEPAPTSRPMPCCPLTFAELCAAFVDAKQGVYKATTLSALAYYLDTQLLPAFGPRKVVQITTPNVAEWFTRYSRSRPGGANQALGHFTTILNWGREAALLPADHPNPASPLRINTRRARGRMLTSTHLRALAEVLDAAPPKTRDAADAVWLILLTGCRSGEILRLRWRDVRKDRLQLPQTKTGPRTVVLSDAAVRHLAGLRTRRRSDYVFPALRSEKPHRTSVDHAWQSFKRRADLPPDIRLHDLRHTYASHALLAGETLHMTGKLLGHASPNSTERYAHLDAGVLAKAAETVAKKIDALLGG
ncbi:MAG: site-specific integrase [Rhodobacteraceae bacterium]|nr:site-specific integrase [Paracoccaceae bacterium]